MDWSGVEREMLVRIVTNAHTYLDGQLKLATAADQRSSALAAAFTAAATAVLAALVVFVTSKPEHLAHSYPVVSAASVSAFGFLAAATLCVSALLPTGVYLPGSQPKHWYSDIARKQPYDDCLAQEAEVTQSKIDDNRVMIERNAKLFKYGAVAGLASPALGTLIWIITSSSYWFL